MPARDAQLVVAFDETDLELVIGKINRVVGVRLADSPHQSRGGRTAVTLTGADERLLWVVARAIHARDFD